MQITVILIAIFFLAQVVGLFTLNQYYKVTPTGEIEYKDLPMSIERPEVEEKVAAIYIAVGILIGTVLLLLLIKIRSKLISKIWFALAIFIGLVIAFGAYIDERIAIVLALIVAVWKVFKPNVFVSNLAEIFVYGGIAVIFHKMLGIFSVVVLLLIIAIYDMIAVWKIKHMITMAKFQTENKMFAGAMIPYDLFTKKPKHKQAKTKKAGKKAGKKLKVPVRVKTAVLGGGDIAFPLLFVGAVMKSFGMGLAFIPVITSTIALIILFIKAEKDKFYPAMPFLAAGCFVGLGLVYLARFWFF